MNTDIMTQAYRMLFEVETTLKETFEDRMQTTYGPVWKRKLNVQKKDRYYHDIVACFLRYEPLIDIFTSEEIHLLYKLNKIRNKVCHMEMIKDEEYNLLKNCHSFVLLHTQSLSIR